MADFVVMPKTDYQAACDAVREKTGKSDLIKSGEMSTEIRNIPTGGDLSEIESLIDESGVLDSTEGTVEEKVESLIEIIEENTLPDWDDDSPIIATGKGYVNRGIWELTEKGTFRWNTDDYGQALITSSDSISALNDYPNYIDIKDKIKQVYIPDGTIMAEFVYMINCVRVRLPDSLTSTLKIAGMTSLKELNLDFDCYAGKLPDYHCARFTSLEKVTLSPLTTIVGRDCFSYCWSLKEINLDNIIRFDANCFAECIVLSNVIVFNSELVSIGNTSFRYTNIQSVTFQESTTGIYPTIANNAFSNCVHLEEVIIPNGWNESLYFPNSPLTQECMHTMIENFADMTDATTTPTFQVGNANLAKIDAYHKTMLDDKGWLYK